MEFKEKLKNLRTAKGLSQEALANELMTSRSTLAKWENGIRLPSMQSFELIADYFEIPLEDLIDDKDTKTIAIQTKDKMDSFVYGVMSVISILLTITISMLFFFKIYGCSCIDVLGINDGKGYIYITYSLSDMHNNPWGSIGLAFNLIFILTSILLFLFRKHQRRRWIIILYGICLCLALIFTVIAFLSGHFMRQAWLLEYFLLEV